MSLQEDRVIYASTRLHRASESLKTLVSPDLGPYKVIPEADLPFYQAALDYVSAHGWEVNQAELGRDKGFVAFSYSFPDIDITIADQINAFIDVAHDIWQTPAVGKMAKTDFSEIFETVQTQYGMTLPKK